MTQLNANEQIIKCRDDKDFVRLVKVPNSSQSHDEFKLANDAHCSWIKDGETVDSGKLRNRIEPWLTALFQTEHLSLLAGSGLTHAMFGHATKGNKLPGMSASEDNFSDFNDEINAEADRSAKAAGREDGNIEDQLRVANELLRGLQIIAPNDPTIEQKAKTLKDDIEKVLNRFAQSILQGENQLLNADTNLLEESFILLVSFLMSFAGRTGTKDRLQIFTTNYDRVIEAGAEAAGLHLLDRFVGSLAPIFRSSRLEIDMHYNPPGIRGEPRYVEGVARFTKMHGSVDWISMSSSIRRIGLPLGAEEIKPYLKAPGLNGATASQLMIFPNEAKDRETASYPYVELFRDFAAATCRPNSVLICYGYSFGDEHINRVIEDMLTIPSTHLVIISYGDKPLERIMNTYEKGHHAQITLMLGSHFGDLKTLVENYLPKPAIDRTTFKLNEILESRWRSADTTPAPKTSD